jgi:hypothetical protein
VYVVTLLTKVVPDTLNAGMHVVALFTVVVSEILKIPVANIFPVAEIFPLIF